MLALVGAEGQEKHLVLSPERLYVITGYYSTRTDTAACYHCVCQKTQTPALQLQSPFHPNIQGTRCLPKVHHFLSFLILQTISSLLL